MLCGISMLQIFSASLMLSSVSCKMLQQSQSTLKKRDTDTFNLHSLLKEKFNHTRSTHCSALLTMTMIHSHANEILEDRQINQKAHFFKV